MTFKTFKKHCVRQAISSTDWCKNGYVCNKINCPLWKKEKNAEKIRTVIKPITKGNIKMGELLYKKFLEEEVEDLKTVILYHGIEGLLFRFEKWLDQNGFLNSPNQKEKTEKTEKT